MTRIKVNGIEVGWFRGSRSSSNRIQLRPRENLTRIPDLRDDSSFHRETKGHAAAHGRIVHLENEKPKEKQLPVSVSGRVLIEQRRLFTNSSCFTSLSVSWPAEKDADQRESLSTRGMTRCFVGPAFHGGRESKSIARRSETRN